MLPNVNFNPSFANLAALRNLGGMPHPIGPISRPMTYTPPMSGSPMPMPGAGPIYPGMPGQQYSMPMQAPQGNLSNLHALMQLLGR